MSAFLGKIHYWLYDKIKLHEKLIENVIELEGMPCDRVNEITENSENIITWKTTRDLHKDYWDEALGDVNNYYYFRDSWINGFLSAGGTGYKYTRTENRINTIRKV